MKAGFSEFSYGFGFVYELASGLNQSSGAPRFLSLREEAKKGYDAAINYNGVALFFQFKLSEYLMRGNSLHRKYYYGPYRRFSITPRWISRQHCLLKEIADDCNLVYYAAPLFHTDPGFDNAFRSNEVATRSLWLPLGKLPQLNGDDYHYVTFDGAIDPKWHSDHPQTIAGDFSGGKALNSIRTYLASSECKVGLIELRARLVEIINGAQGERVREEPQDIPTLSPPGDPSEIARDVVRLLSVHFGLEMLIAPTTPV